jgi:hypothetical protein
MRTHQGREHRGKVCSLEASPGLFQDPPALALVAYAAHGRVEGDLPEERPAKPRQEADVVRNLSHPRGLLLRSPLPYGFRYWLTAADLETSALRPHLRRLPYGKKRDTALKRADLVAFMERTVVIPRMAPVTNMFKFPSWLTDRSRLAASSGVSEAGVVPDSIGTAPSGAWPVSALP